MCIVRSEPLSQRLLCLSSTETFHAIVCRAGVSAYRPNESVADSVYGPRHLTSPPTEVLGHYGSRDAFYASFDRIFLNRGWICRR
jgi:hypothetical protein